MISLNPFEKSVAILDALTDSPFKLAPCQGVDILFALKVLNQAATQGSDEEKKILSLKRKRITLLNGLIKKGELAARAKTCFNLEIRQKDVEGIKVSLPQTSFEKMVEVATKIPRILITCLIDLLLLPGALALLIAACCKANFNPKFKHVKQKVTPILLIHGSGFNESEWIIGRQFLKKHNFGSVFSLNYDGLVSNDPKKGVEDYAREQISKEVRSIKAKTGCEKVILIGHSMGGMIAGYYAEHISKEDEVRVDHVISIATPWQGTPMIDRFWKLGGIYSKERETKRHLQMSVLGGDELQPKFRQGLVAKALDSERKAVRKYYNIWSSTDYAVPGFSGSLTEDPRRQRSFSFLGHYGLAVWPSVWFQTRSWLNDIYGQQEKHSLTFASAV